MRRMRPAFGLALALGLVAPGALSWGNDAIDEPSSALDTPGWMWPTANDRSQLVAGEMRDRLYFNGQLSLIGLVPIPQAPGGRLPVAVVGAEAMLGYWRDCNNDGYVGNRATGQVRYPVQTAAVDVAVCPPGSAFNPQQTTNVVVAGRLVGAAGPWIHEYVQVGSYRGIGGTSVAYSIDDGAARVWADVHRPTERAYAPPLDVVYASEAVDELPASLRLGDVALRVGSPTGPRATMAIVAGEASPFAEPLLLPEAAFRVRTVTYPLKRANDLVLAPQPPRGGAVNAATPWLAANANKDLGAWFSRDALVLNASEADEATYVTFYARVGPVGLNGRNGAAPTFRAPGPVGLPGARLERGEWTAPVFAYGEEACAAPAATRWDCSGWPAGPFPAWAEATDRAWGAILGSPYHLRDTDCVDLTPAAPDAAREARDNANFLWDYALSTASRSLADETGPLLGACR